MANLLTGGAATTVAVIATAGLGIAMLAGRIPARRALATAVGCAIVFAAPVVAAALIDQAPPPVSDIPIAPQAIRASPAPQPFVYDPYAGAAVPIRPGDDPLMPRSPAQPAQPEASPFIR